MKHSLTEKDKKALVATCSVCGPGAKIRRRGKYGHACIVGDREAKRRYKQAHPERAARQSRGISSHSLARRDGTDTGCAVCGPVTPIKWRRGFMCPNRAMELGWKPDAKPAPRCETCDSWLRADNGCTFCERSALRPLPRSLERELAAAGMHVEFEPTVLSDEIENAVPGWRTLGNNSPRIGFAHYADEWAGKPKYIRPEYAALYGSGRRGPV